MKHLANMIYLTYFILELKKNSKEKMRELKTRQKKLEEFFVNYQMGSSYFLRNSRLNFRYYSSHKSIKRLRFFFNLNFKKMPS